RRAFSLYKGLSGRTIFYVGTLEPRKNLTMLLQAFSELASDPNFDDTTLVIGGSKGWYYDEVFATAERLGLMGSGRVRFLGRVPDEELPLWYNVASVFVFPSIYEGFGLPPLEAMACGAPVITSNTSSLPEVVGDAGIMLPPGDPGAWAVGMRLMLSDQGTARELGTRGLERSKQFSWDRAARETLDVYRLVLGEKRKRGRSAAQFRSSPSIQK
ncbi:MAG: glycosyltransferase family 1 protein, partial [Chloroflexia bacterium]